MSLTSLFPFISDLFVKRNVTSAPSGWYKPIRHTGDNNGYNAFEPTFGPPNLDLNGRGSNCAQSPGPVGSLFLPQIEIPSAPTSVGLQTASYIGGNSLFTDDSSSPEQEIF